MDGTENTAAIRSRTEGRRHGLTFGLMGLVMIGAVGLLVQNLAGPETAQGSAPHVSQLGVITPQRVARAWTGAVGEVLHASAADASMGTPLVLVAGGLAELDASGLDERGLLLEVDGTLRRESCGTLVGFLQDGAMPERGDLLSGPLPIALSLLHQDSWLAESARVPVLEEDGVDRWVVLEHRSYQIEVAREPVKPYQVGPGRPMLHPRTGLPQVELIAQRD